MSGPLNYTTQIKADKTAGECLAMLGTNGASAIAITYQDRKPSGIAFRLDTPHGVRQFQLPVNVGGMHKSLMKANQRGDIPVRYTEVEHARRVAWRVAKDWLAAQLAIVAAEMASLDEVFLPYLQVESGQTLYEAYREREHLAIES